MSLRLSILAVVVAASVEAQQPSAERLRSLAERSDRDSLLAEVRRQPADARELLGQFIAQAGRLRAPGTADSVIQLAHRVAVAYATAWQDSFPATNLARFEQMSIGQRAAKVAADSVRLAGNAALGTKGVGAAIALWRIALRRSLAIPDTAAAAAALGNIGAGFYQAAELDSAESYLSRARHLAERTGDRRTTLNALGALGNVAKDRGDLRRAQEILSQTLEQRTRFGDVRGAVADHTNLGLISAELDDRGEARTHYQQGLSLARQHRLDEGAATALLNLGNLAGIDGEFAEATDRYREALALYRSLANEADAALVLHNLGLLALRRGDYKSARTHLVAALAVFARIGTLEDQVQVRRDLATVDAATGNLQSALVQLRRAEQLLVRATERPGLAAAVALARADLAVQLNTYAEAERHYARAQALYRRAGAASGESEAQQGRAMLLVERKQYSRALEQLRLVARRQAAVDNRRPAALTRLMIGHVQQQQGRVADARRTLEQALDTLHALGDAVGEASALAALGELELENGSRLAAEAHYRAGIARLDNRIAPMVSWQLHAGLGQALRGRGVLNEAAAELLLAIADVERMAASLTLEERRSTFLADKWDAYEALVRVEHERGDMAAAFAVSEQLRARLMRDLLSRGRVERPGTADSAIIAQEQDLRVRIAELTQRLEAEEAGGVVSTLRGPDMSSSSTGVTREALARVQEQYAQLLLELRDEGGMAPILRGDVVPWRVVASRLSRGQALLTYLVTDSTTMVFVLTPDTMRVLDLGVGRGTLATLVDFARGTIGRRPLPGTPSPWRTPLRRLHQHLITPVEDAGLLAGVRRLVIVPHSELHYLPFAALLRDGERDEFLIERYDIGYAPSASAWVQLGERGSSSSDRILALAPRSKELPGSGEEVEAIRGLYGRQATVLTNGSATEQVFRATVQRYGIVHLATYGVLNQHNPLFSFVDLSRGGESDGRLEVHEVFGLSLNARLLVLSACQTALASGAVSDIPAGDDWVGLVRAFLGAGAGNVIATLWAVEDRSTARVMERLHRRLRAGDAETVALSQAQRETLRNPATSGPFYWAGFVLVGGR